MAESDRKRQGRDGRRDPAETGRPLVLRVARRRFLEQGYAAASMADIAADAGVTKAALYYHFPGKDALFTSVFIAEVERLSAGISAIASDDGSLADLLTRIAAYAFQEAGDGMVRLQDDMIRHIDPAVVEAALGDRPTPRTVLGALVDAHRHHLRAGFDPAFVAEAFFGLVMSRIHAEQWQACPGLIGPIEAGHLVDLFLSGAIDR